MRARALLLAVVAVAALLGVAAAATVALECRLVELAPGGVQFAALHYNPFTGHLALVDVRARDAAGRELFRADSVVASASPLRLLTRPLTLAHASVAGPRLTLRAPGFDLAELAAGFGAAPAVFGLGGTGAGPAWPGGGLPLRLEDLVLAGGSVVVEGAGESGAPLNVRDLDLRLSRLTTATVDHPDVAFAVEMAVNGALVHVTGQPRGGGYAIRVRARGLDVAALARDARPSVLDGLQRGRGEIDADLLLAGGRVLASGFARLGDVVLALPVSGRPPLRAATLTLVADAFDLVSGTGRITRLELGAPVLALPLATAGPTLAALGESLRAHPGLLLRRIAITDGTLALTGTGGVRLDRVQLAAHTPERRGDGEWIVSARAAPGTGAEVSLDGVLARDLLALDASARLQRVALAPWRALTDALPDGDARVSFEGRFRLVAREGEPAVTLAGQAVLADVSAAGPDGFRAERIVLGAVPLRSLLTALEAAVRTANDSGAPAGLPATVLER